MGEQDNRKFATSNRSRDFDLQIGKTAWNLQDNGTDGDDWCCFADGNLRRLADQGVF